MRHLREGSLPTYQLSFLMTEYLIQRDGFSRLVEYFAVVARSRDRRANFRRAFGQSFEQFEGEVLEYLQMLVLEGEPEISKPSRRPGAHRLRADVPTDPCEVPARIRCGAPWCS